jgi:hypothetical protein
MIFQETSHKNRPIIITKGPKSLKLLYSIIDLNTIPMYLVGKANKSDPESKERERERERERICSKRGT